MDYRDDPTGLDCHDHVPATSDHASGTQSRANRRIANAGRVRVEPPVAISWNRWSSSAGSAGRLHWNAHLSMRLRDGRV
jgi:hypothetical protein